MLASYDVFACLGNMGQLSENMYYFFFRVNLIYVLIFYY